MAVKSVLTTKEHFTGEIPLTEQTAAMWRFNELLPDEEIRLLDSSGNGRHITISGWDGTSAGLPAGRHGRYFRMNIINPANEKTHLIALNDGGYFNNLGDKIAVGGWINPTTYSIGNTYTPIFNTRQGPGQPIFYISLYQGRPRMMLYNSAGTLILDQTETPPFSFANGGWYFIGAIIGVTAKTSQFIICKRADGLVWKAPVRTFTGVLNASCNANIVMGMHADTYWYAGGLDDWFFETDSKLTADDLAVYFRQSLLGNGADSASNIDAFTEPGTVLLKNTDGAYAESGVLETIAAKCSLAGNGRVSVNSEYIPGVTAISLVETSTSDDLTEWTIWQSTGTSGELASPNKEFIRFRITLATNNTARTPKLLEIQLHDIPRPPYERLGFARPVILDKNGAWETVLENAFDVLVTGEVNGIDTLEFKIPFNDSKRVMLDNEKRIQIADNVYHIRLVTDERNSDGMILTTIYAEAAFYDLAYSTKKESTLFTDCTPETPMLYALANTGWSLGTVTVSTMRTWESQEKNPLTLLRKIQEIHGGDLVFDNANSIVHLLTFSGKDSGALFAYKKNITGIQRVIDTRGLITRLFAYGRDGMTFGYINGGKDYVEDYTYSEELRVMSLDCSDFTDPYQMLEFAKMRLADYSRPRVSYVLSAMDLSVLTGYEHEQWNLGDIVSVNDRDLGITIKTRIVRREYNLQEPWKTRLELSSKLRELGTASQYDRLSDQIQSVADSAYNTQQDLRCMVPFNHIRNSRADNGFAYWQNSGFEIDTKNGVTGTASFKVTGALGTTKSMSQTVYPASRTHYTFSAQVASNNLLQGANGRVGADVIFEYDDGTKETKFIDFSTVEYIDDKCSTVEVIGGIPEAPRDGKIYGRNNGSWVETISPLEANTLRYDTVKVFNYLSENKNDVVFADMHNDGVRLYKGVVEQDGTEQYTLIDGTRLYWYDNEVGGKMTASITDSPVLTYIYTDYVYSEYTHKTRGTIAEIPMLSFGYSDDGYKGKGLIYHTTLDADGTKKRQLILEYVKPDGDSVAIYIGDDGIKFSEPPAGTVLEAVDMTTDTDGRITGYKTKFNGMPLKQTDIIYNDEGKIIELTSGTVSIPVTWGN